MYYFDLDAQFNGSQRLLISSSNFFCGGGWGDNDQLIAYRLFPSANYRHYIGLWKSTFGQSNERVLNAPLAAVVDVWHIWLSHI